MNMWELIKKLNMSPSRWKRFCCVYLKEYTLIDSTQALITGVRASESRQRKMNRALIEMGKGKRTKINKICEGNAEIFKAYTKPRIVNPIYGWSEADVWQFLKDRGVQSCSLYNEGWKRLGCIGCPMASKKQRARDFARWPQYAKMWIRALDQLDKEKLPPKLKEAWSTGEKAFEWYLNQP